VSEVKDWILTGSCLLHSHVMDKEIGRRLQEIMERRFARQTEDMKEINAKIDEMKADVNAQAAARQDKADAEAKTCQDQSKEDIRGYMEARLKGLRSSGKGTTACQVQSVVCPENSKAGLKTVEADVIKFEKSPDRMEATNLEVNPETTEAILECQELRMEEADVDTIGSSEDRYGDRCLVVRRRRWAKKWIQGSFGSCQRLSARKRLISVPSLECARDVPVRGPEISRTLVKS
jgi:hypothetical protein